MMILTERNIQQYAQTLVDVRGKHTPYVAAIYAVVRREYPEPREFWRLWLAVGKASATLIGGATANTLH